MLTTATPKVLRSAASNPYCVPAALSALLNIHVDSVLRLIEQHLGDQPVSGLYYPIAIRILRDSGFTVRELTYGMRHSVLSLTKHLSSVKTYFVLIKGHALVMHNRTIVDNSYPEGVMPENYLRKRDRVEQVFEVSR